MISLLSHSTWRLNERESFQWGLGRWTVIIKVRYYYTSVLKWKQALVSCGSLFSVLVKTHHTSSKESDSVGLHYRYQFGLSWEGNSREKSCKSKLTRANSNTRLGWPATCPLPSAFSVNCVSDCSWLSFHFYVRLSFFSSSPTRKFPPAQSRHNSFISSSSMVEILTKNTQFCIRIKEKLHKKTQLLVTHFHFLNFFSFLFFSSSLSKSDMSKKVKA